MQLQETKKTKTTIKELAYNYRHVWVLFYGVIYLTWFAWLEQTVTKKFHIITMPVDLKIPFCEYFIIPYLLWFLYSESCSFSSVINRIIIKSALFYLPE